MPLAASLLFVAAPVWADVSSETRVEEKVQKDDDSVVHQKSVQVDRESDGDSRSVEKTRKERVETGDGDVKTEVHERVDTRKSSDD